MFHGIHQQHKMQLQREQKIKRRQSAKVTENHHLGWHIFAKHIIRSQINIAFKDSTERLPLSKQCDTETHWSSDWQSPSQNFPAEPLMSASTTVTSNINANTNNFILSLIRRRVIDGGHFELASKGSQTLIKTLEMKYWKLCYILLYYWGNKSKEHFKLYNIYNFHSWYFLSLIRHSKQAIWFK